MSMIKLNGLFTLLPRRRISRVNDRKPSWIWRRPAQRPFRAPSARMAGGRLVRDHLREFSRIAGPPAVRAGANRRALSGRDAWGVAVERQPRSAVLKLSR